MGVDMPLTCCDHKMKLGGSGLHQHHIASSHIPSALQPGSPQSCFPASDTTAPHPIIAHRRMQRLPMSRPDQRLRHQSDTINAGRRLSSLPAEAGADKFPRRRQDIVTPAHVRLRPDIG